MNRLKTLPLLAAVAATAHAGESKSGMPSSGDWEFSLSFGSGYRQAGTLGFTGGSRSPGRFIPSFVGNDSLFIPPVGDASVYDDRFYDDGYVRPDHSTGIDGLTGFWGYRNASQVDLANDAIRFHATGAQSIRSDIRSVIGIPHLEDKQRGLAPVLHFEARHRKKFLRGYPGFSATLSWLPVEFERSWSDFSLTQIRDDYRLDVTDTYNLGGVGEEIPQPPYSGTFGGPGFLLENLPDSRTTDPVLINTDTAVLRNNINARFSAEHTSFSFGPTMTHEANSSWKLQAGTGVSLHWLHWSSRQSERLNLTQSGVTRQLDRWDHAASGDKILAGLYLQLLGEWSPPDSLWSAKGLLRVEVGQSFSSQIGPSRFTYDTDGVTAVLMVSRRL